MTVSCATSPASRYSASASRPPRAGSLSLLSPAAVTRTPIGKTAFRRVIASAGETYRSMTASTYSALEQTPTGRAAANETSVCGLKPCEYAQGSLARRRAR